MLFIELRGFYQKEDLARFFAPILGTDNDFKENVLRIYPQVETAQELIDRLNMSPSAFKRKFRETFGISARQWLIRKKEQKLIRDILMTNISIAELAEKIQIYGQLYDHVLSETFWQITDRAALGTQEVNLFIAYTL